MEKKKVICSECGKFLFESEKDNWGAVGAEALRKGYIYKVPILYRSIKAERLFFCDKACNNAYFVKHTEEKERNEVRGTINKAGQQFTQDKAAERLSKVAYTFVQRIGYLRTELKKGRRLRDIVEERGMEDIKDILKQQGKL